MSQHNSEHVLVMLNEIEDKVKQSFCDLNTKQINWQADKKSWSIGSCMAHLVLSNELYIQVLEEVKNNTHYKGFWTKLPYWNTVWGKILINSVDPEKNKKSPTTKELDTIGKHYTSKIFDEFLESQTKVKLLAHELDTFEQDKIVVSFPAIKRITMKLEVAFEVLWKHELKHFNQAMAVLNNKDFPKD